MRATTREETRFTRVPTGMEEECVGDESYRRRGTLWLLIRLTFCMFGIGYAWAAQFARGASLFEDLGLSDDGVSLAFLAGPICGLVVQPIVGTLSDTTKTRCGRRRPWIAAGLTLVVMSFLVLGDAYSLGDFLGDHSTQRPRAVSIAIAAFWVRSSFKKFVCFLKCPMTTKKNTLDLN